MNITELKKKIQANTDLDMASITAVVKFTALIIHQDPKAKKAVEKYGKLVETNERKRWSKP